MKKKILIICIAVILLASIVAVSAVTDDHDEKGVKYNVPDGFTINKKYPSIQNIYDSYGNGTVYNYTNGTHNLKIVIFNLTNPLSSIDDLKDDVKGEKTTIAGVNGYLKEWKNYVSFYCIKDGKLLRIDAPNEDVIKEIFSGKSSSDSKSSGLPFDFPFDFKLPKIL